MFQSPEVLDVLYPVIAPHLRNPPALAWALISNADNAANLDGLAFQKLPTSKYKQVKMLLLLAFTTVLYKCTCVQYSVSCTCASTSANKWIFYTSAIK
jgi:hypothetical protein